MPTEEDVEMAVEEEATTEKSVDPSVTKNDNDSNGNDATMAVKKQATKATTKRGTAKEKDEKTKNGGKTKNGKQQSSTKAAGNNKKKPAVAKSSAPPATATGQLTLGAFFTTKKSSSCKPSSSSSLQPTKGSQSTSTKTSKNHSQRKDSASSTKKSTEEGVVATSTTTSTATATVTTTNGDDVVSTSTSAAATKRRNELRDIALGLRLPSQTSKKQKVQHGATGDENDETETKPLPRDDENKGDDEPSPKTPALAASVTSINKDMANDLKSTTVTTATTTVTTGTNTTADGCALSGGAPSTTTTNSSSLLSPIPGTSSVKPGKLVHRFNEQEEPQLQAKETVMTENMHESPSAVDYEKPAENDDDDDKGGNSSSSDNKQDDEDQSSIAPEESAATVPVAASLECKQKTTDDDSVISEEAKTTLAKHEKMRERYCCRASEVLRQSQSLEEEEEDGDLDIAAVAVFPANGAAERAGGGDDFPDFAVKHLAAFVEGSKLPLSALTTLATGKLNKIYNNSNKEEGDGGDSTSVFCFQEEATAAQIKLLATRKNYIKNPSIASGLTTTAVPMDPTTSGKRKDSVVTNIFEDDCEDCMWRWEVQIVDILPQQAIAHIKKARAARKKVGTHFNALAKLLASLNEADELIYANEKATSKSTPAIATKLAKLLARISQEEEKVLKYEREAEKARLSSQAKDMKKAAKEQKEREEQEKKNAAKEQLAQEKERKKEEAARERELKKQELAQKKEAAAEIKRKKQEQIEKAEAQKSAQLNKQRKCMQSFFTAKPVSAKKAAAPDAAADVDESEPNATPAKVDNDTKVTDSSPPFTGISEVEHSTPYIAGDCKNKRKRKTKMVTVSVHITPELSQGVWGAQPFAELHPVKVRNGFKFLRFHEDIRPAYHGTWSKKSAIVTGRTPFAKDPKFLNYDYDSEAEWEEGDDEVGEDVENDAGDEEEEKDDEEQGDDDDGWLAADDEFGDDPDEETIRLRKKMRAGEMSRPRNGENVVCIIAPIMGMPIAKMDIDYVGSLVEGFAFQEGIDLLNMHSTETVNFYSLYLDAFPPPFCEEVGEEVASPSDGSKALSSKDMSIQDQQTFMRFVHNSSWGSKDKLVDEFRTAHPSITSSRALIVRTLESSADKKKHPIKGAIWEVKREILEKLELNELAEQDTIDPEDAKKQILKEIAMSVHHATFSSKEKLADALLATQSLSFSISRAELMRHLEAMAEKKKIAGGVYWEVKADVKDELGLTDKLSSSPPSLSSSSNDSAETPSTKVDETVAKEGSVAASKEEKSDKKSSSTGMKRKAAENNKTSAGSSKLLASFLTKKM